MRNGAAGSPSWLPKLGAAVSSKAKRISLGSATSALVTTMVSPEIIAVAGRNFPSAPAARNHVSALPSSDDETLADVVEVQDRLASFALDAARAVDGA